jgi:hypothetical protein
MRMAASSDTSALLKALFAAGPVITTLPDSGACAKAVAAIEMNKIPLAAHTKILRKRSLSKFVVTFSSRKTVYDIRCSLLGNKARPYFQAFFGSGAS